ncbi:MAG: leucyl aminopeptidase family protein [Bacteroidetes bacterium]|nr:leucyl aminopeptidase family protein [Bacteroidota bacterium]HET6242964.1 leucyl aminopeptidase family protein [Bacteroidia bacterium]
MNTTIKKTIKDEVKNYTVFICSAATKPEDLGLNETEITALKKEMAKDKKLLPLSIENIKTFVYFIPENKDVFKTLEACRVQGNSLLKILNEEKTSEVTLIDFSGFPEEVIAFAEGIVLGNYQFLKYFSDSKKRKNSLNKILVFGEMITDEKIRELQNCTDAVCFARDLVNEPVCFLTAEKFSEEIKKAGKATGFKVEVFNHTKIKALRMGGLLAVNKGSIDPPTFTIMEYKPANAKNKKPYVLVGKGVVYDTGGVNIKVQGMELMKCDMGGAAAVVGAITAIASEKIPIHVIALVPATDNRPGGNAYVPGDIITMFDGSTVEVLNTDAEGRMILADALSYAKKFKPELVIDVATLTGAALRAIGMHGMVAMGNTHETMDQLKESGEKVYERLVEFPLWDEYADDIKSAIADIKNLGNSGYAGASSAGKFLEHFTDYPWMHLDIAGPAFFPKDDHYRVSGGTGYGVRLLYDFLKKQVTEEEK